MSEIVLTHQANPGAQGSGLSALYFNASGVLCKVGPDGTEVPLGVDDLPWKQSVRVATTAAGTLASSFTSGSAIDGVTLATGDRILIKNQSAASENGIYIVAASGAPARAPDADTGTKLLGATVLVREGATYADTMWICPIDAITIGSTSITWIQRGALSGGSSSTDKTLARWNGTAGNALQASGVTLSDADEIHGYLAKVNFQTGTTYTVDVAGVDTDSGKVVDHSNAGAITVTLPNSAPVGFACTYVQSGAGQITFAAGSGATLLNRQSHAKTAGQWAMVTLYVRSNGGGSSAVWVLGGDTAA